MTDIQFQSGISDKDRMDIAIRDFEAGQHNDKQYQMMLGRTADLMEELCPSPSAILEFGAGTGLFSQMYVSRFPESKIVITEPDSLLIAEIPKKLEAFSNIKYVQALAQSFSSEIRFDIITGTEAYHHVPDDQKKLLFENFKRLLNPGGFVVIGDNFIPEYDQGDPKDRIRALHDFWDPYIKAKQDAGDEEGVRTFTFALHQAEAGVMEYKTSLGIFEKYAAEVGFKVFKKEELSENINTKGGYCVYALRI